MKRDLDQETAIKNILEQGKRFALVGASKNPVKASFFVATYLACRDFDFVCVNPKHSELFERPCFASLKDVSPKPDVVVVFRKAEKTPEIAKEAVSMGAKALWLQYGIRSDESRAIASEAGLLYVEDRCLKVEHARFMGGLHKAAVKTGALSAKKKRRRHAS